MTQRNVKFQCYLWPDHVIGKRESRTIREEHNALVNSHAELLAALQKTLAALEAHLDESCRDHNLGHRDMLCPCNQNEVVQARAAIAKATGEN